MHLCSSGPLEPGCIPCACHPFSPLFHVLPHPSPAVFLSPLFFFSSELAWCANVSTFLSICQHTVLLPVFTSVSMNPIPVASPPSLLFLSDFLEMFLLYNFYLLFSSVPQFFTLFIVYAQFDYIFAHFYFFNAILASLTPSDRPASRSWINGISFE